jgi:hypothetical protein
VILAQPDTHRFTVYNFIRKPNGILASNLSTLRLNRIEQQIVYSSPRPPALLRPLLRPLHRLHLLRHLLRHHLLHHLLAHLVADVATPLQETKKVQHDAVEGLLAAND